MYGKAVLIEEINKLIGESLSNYIQENDLNILGEPLPSETEQKELNLDEESFEFVYDIAFVSRDEREIEQKRESSLLHHQGR